jgi:hypothetical protein
VSLILANKKPKMIPNFAGVIDTSYASFGVSSTPEMHALPVLLILKKH